MSKDPNQLIAECQGLVRSIAWKIHRKLPPQVELDDLIAYGNLGLAQAARDFDADRGWRFTTFAYHRIRGAILDGLTQMNWFKLADYHRGRYSELSQDVIDHEQEGSPGARRDVEEEGRWLQTSCGRLAMVQLLCQRGSGEDQLVDAGAPSPVAVVSQRELGQKLRELVDALPPPADELIRATYFEGLTLKEAGERLGRSKAWASRLHAKALDRLARRMRSLAAC